MVYLIRQCHLKVFKGLLPQILLGRFWNTLSYFNSWFTLLSSDLQYYKTSSCTEATTEGVLLKEVFLKTLPNSQENTCARVSFFNQVADLSLELY